MKGQEAFELIKVIASIFTAMLVAVFGIVINRTIQRQNANAQRKSSWLTKWSDDFLKTASDFNEFATSFFMACWWLNARQMGYSPPGFPDEAEHDSAIGGSLQELMHNQWRLQKFLDFAPKNANELEEAAKNLVDEASDWTRSKPANIALFREKQSAFNRCVRRAHAELLGLSPLDD